MRKSAGWSFTEAIEMTLSHMGLIGPDELFKFIPGRASHAPFQDDGGDASETVERDNIIQTSRKTATHALPARTNTVRGDNTRSSGPPIA